jgi:cytochrome b561
MTDESAMTFRVGLLFHFTPAQPFVLGSITAQLQKIDERTGEVRGGQRLTLVPFIRTTDMAVFAQSAANSRYDIEAAAFDNAGVRFGPIDAFVQIQHPEYDNLLDFELGVKVLLTRCDVVIIVCKDDLAALEVKQQLAIYHNTHTLFVLLPIQSGMPIFIEVNPLPREKDEPSWLLTVTEWWERTEASLPPLPSQKWTMLGRLFPLFYSAVIRRRYETVKKRKPTEADRCRDGMGLSVAADRKLESSDRNLLEAVLLTLCPYFARHGDLGKHYSNVFRTTCLLVPTLIVASVVLAVTAPLDSVRHDLWHVMEAALLIIAGLLFLRSKLAKHHRKWVENRLITELLRPVLLHELFHTMPRLIPPNEEPEMWLDRSRLLLRHLRSLPPVAFTTSTTELLSARVSAVHDFVKFQAGWHRDFAEQHQVAEKRLSKMSAHAFIGILGLCALQLIISYVLTQAPKYLHEAPKLLEGATEFAHVLAYVLTLLTLASTGGAFVLLLLLHQLGFEQIAERSNNASEHFKALQEEIERTGHNADARQAYVWADKCAAAILAEQHSWYRQIPLIRMHL